MTFVSRELDRIYRWCAPTPAPYFELLDRIQRFLLPRSYVEVGVASGRSLALALPGTLCVGIDPSPNILYGINRTTKIVTLKSDEFFEEDDLATVLEGLPLDLAFIDGMHHFEVALRDFMNLERVATSDTTVLIHDCLPIDEITAARDRSTLLWSGDVWRLIVCLKEWRPDLRVAVVDVGPTGLGVIRGLDPASRVLSECYDEIVDHYLDVTYGELERMGKDEALNVVPYDWIQVRSLLPPRPFRIEALQPLLNRRTVRAVWPAVRLRARQRAGSVLRRGRPT